MGKRPDGLWRIMKGRHYRFRTFRMKRLLPLIVVVASLALVPGAFAKDGTNVTWRTTTVTGNRFNAKTVSGSCSAGRVLLTAVLRCGSDSGQAAVRYIFKVPGTCLPQVDAHVDAVGDKKVSVATTTGQVRVTVRLSDPGLLTIASVNIGYYC
jgi:hypothetical protein